MNIRTEDLFRIREEYKNLDFCILRFPHKKEWDNRLITEGDGYQIPSSWSNRDLDTLLTQLQSSIETGQMRGCECKIIVAGACYLRKPSGSSDDRLLDSTNFGSVSLDWDTNGVVESSSSIQPVVLSATDRAYGLFICGFLFKILSKPSQKVEQSWSHVKERYLNFYSSNKTPKEWPKPQLQWLEMLKHRFSHDERALLTALRLVNNLEMIYTDVTKVESSLIRYLFVMPLSYTGMHAYKLFCDVKEKTGQETSWLVSRLSCLHFRDELATIDEISQKWDLGGPDTNPAFRYARLLGPYYFPEIQTKNCTAFVYCLARILSRYDSSGNNCNPEQIVGLDKLSDVMKARMDKIASEIYKICN